MGVVRKNIKYGTSALGHFLKFFKIVMGSRLWKIPYFGIVFSEKKVT